MRDSRVHEIDCIAGSDWGGLGYTILIGRHFYHFTDWGHSGCIYAC
jgi:hypothetical protein